MNQPAHLLSRFAAEGHLAALHTNLYRDITYKYSPAVNLEHLRYCFHSAVEAPAYVTGSHKQYLREKQTPPFVGAGGGRAGGGANRKQPGEYLSADSLR